MLRAALAACLLAFQAGGPTPSEFERGLQSVQSHLDGGRWTKAKRSLQSLLRDHEGAAHVLVELPRVREMLTTASFWGQADPPDLDQLVSGELESVNRRSGRVTLGYGPHNLGDFERTPSSTLHKAVFAGPYSVELETDRRPPPFIVCIESGRFHVVRFYEKIVITTKPAKRETRWVTFDEVVNGKVVKSERSDFSPIRSREPEVFKVKVDSGVVRAYFRGKSVGSVAKPVGLYGRLGFGSLPDTYRVEVSGQVSPGWLQGLEDTAVQEERAAFESRYDPADDFPDWLLARLAESDEPEDTEPADEPRYPGPTNERRDAVWRELEAMIEDDELRAARNRTRDLDEPRLFRSWVRAVIDLADERFEDALSACEFVLDAEPGYLPALRAKARALDGLRRYEESLSVWLSATAARPDAVEGWRESVLRLMRQGRLEEAEGALRIAIGGGIDPGSLATVAGALQKAKSGPTWARPAEYESRHYRVVSDLDPDLCRKAALELEECFRQYGKTLERAEHDEEQKFRVYLFSGQASYLDYTRDLLGRSHNWSAGIYTPWARQLLVWNLPDREQMMRTIRHEGFHQFFDRLVDDPPIWLNEGLAEYFEIGRRPDGSWRLGRPHPDHVAYFRRNRRVIPLWKFLHESPRDFQSDPASHYPQAWALVCFLLESGPQWRARFDALLAALQEGVSNREAIERVFDKATLDELDRGLRSFIDERR